MMQLRKIMGLVLLFFILTSVCSWNGDARGIGVGPNYIRLDSALRGSSYKQTLYVYNQNDYDSTILLNSTGEAGEWVTFYEPSNLEKPVNSTFVHAMSSKNIVIQITIPEDAANREYNGTVIVSSEPADTNVSGNYTTVSLNIPVLLFINVTGYQILNVSVLYIEVDNVEIGYPCRLRLQFRNTGNVEATPHTEVIITKDGRYIDSLSGSTDPIQLDQLGNQELIWNTTGMVAGNYVAHFNITLDGKLVEERDVSFRLFPPGTFTRNGTLLGITYEGKPAKGKVLKIIATFRNTGDVDTPAKFIGEVYKDGELVDVIESKEITVPKYRKENLYAYYKIKENGTYVIKGYVLYGSKTTNTTELSFSVGVKKPSSFDVLTTVTLVAIGAVVGASVILWKRREKEVIRIKVPLSFRIATAVERMKNSLGKGSSSGDSKLPISREEWESKKEKRVEDRRKLRDQRRLERQRRSEERIKAREARRQQRKEKREQRIKAREAKRQKRKEKRMQITGENR